MSRGRPRHQTSRRRTYSARQRDLRERRIHEHSDDYPATIESIAVEPDDAREFDLTPWAARLQARAGAA
jgi:hypothetical protein